MSSNFLEEALTSVTESKKSILHLYSVRNITQSQRMKAKRRGVKVECKKRDKGWFEVNLIV